MKAKATSLDFLLAHSLAIASGVGLVLTSAYAGRLPHYDASELKVLLLLSALFVAIRGLQTGGFMSKIAHSIRRGRLVAPKLVLATFFSSMLVTNDVAILVMVPITLALQTKRRDVLVILEVLAANAGSALTPIGNPQNLFLYWRYGMSIGSFVSAIAPLSMTFLGILAACSIRIEVRADTQGKPPPRVRGSAYVYLLLLAIVVLAVLRVLPYPAGLLVILFALLRDRGSLRIDYSLLLTFLFLFGIADNLRIMIGQAIGHTHHVFVLSALASQVMSNVPATILFAEFTTHWKALLWGANVGGFGSLFASFANLIAYRLYVTDQDTNNGSAFAAKFLAAGYIALSASVGLYFLLTRASGPP